MIPMRPDWEEIKQEFVKKDIFSLDNVPYNERRFLPDSPGVYLFVDGASVLYVGQSKNIRSRCSSHPKAKEVSALSDMKIYWIQCRSIEMRFIERLLMCLYCPTLNRQEIHGGVPLISAAKINEFANAIGFGDGQSLLQALTAGYFKGDSVTVEFCPPNVSSLLLSSLHTA